MYAGSQLVAVTLMRVRSACLEYGMSENDEKDAKCSPASFTKHGKRSACGSTGSVRFSFGISGWWEEEVKSQFRIDEGLFRD